MGGAHPDDSRRTVLSDFRERRLPAGPGIECDEPGDSPKIRSSGISSRLARALVFEVPRKRPDRVEGGAVFGAARSRSLSQSFEKRHFHGLGQQLKHAIDRKQQDLFLVRLLTRA